MGDLVVALGRGQRGAQIAAGNGQHAVTQRRQPRHQVAIYVEPGESHQQRQRQAADGDAGDDRPVVDLTLPVDRGLKLLAQLDRQAVQCLRQCRQRFVGEDRALDQPIEIGRAAGGDRLRLSVFLRRPAESLHDGVEHARIDLPGSVRSLDEIDQGRQLGPRGPQLGVAVRLTWLCHPGRGQLLHLVA